MKKFFRKLLAKVLDLKIWCCVCLDLALFGRTHTRELKGKGIRGPSGRTMDRNIKSQSKAIKEWAKVRDDIPSKMKDIAQELEGIKG